jgi:hypothetical protein
LKHARNPFSAPTPEGEKREGTFHHLIPLFCTLAANQPRTRDAHGKIFNEIKDLEALLHKPKRKKAF